MNQKLFNLMISLSSYFHTCVSYENECLYENVFHSSLKFGFEVECNYFFRAILKVLRVPKVQHLAKIF